MRGYTRPNLFRMRQFYEEYRDDQKVSSLMRQLPWTHHLLILGQAKLPEERRFYILAAIAGKWTTRELERQLRTHAFRRNGIPRGTVSAALTQLHPAASDEFKNAYNLEFLDLRDGHSEADLHGSLLHNLGRFITELGRDFCFVGSEYPIQVGNQDFAIDLVFFHRGLTCLVAFELKVRKFEPADLGQLSFYLEALDREVKKPHERPSIGVLLCATKDDKVVEYALARTTSSALVAEYHSVLPSKALLRRKLHSCTPSSRPTRERLPLLVEAEPAQAGSGEQQREAVDGAERAEHVGEAGAAADQEGVVALERPAVGNEQADLLQGVRHQGAREHAAADQAHDHDQDRAERRDLLLGR
jgi:predicted nuclease of restriction endonuclease-like (RecB) superfamily